MTPSNRPKTPARRKLAVEEGLAVPIVPPADAALPPRTPQRAGAVVPTSEQIAERAYWIYLARGSSYGDPIADWLQAERELIDELNPPKKRSRSSKG